ncbi:MAG: hypothetical protein K2P52_08455 [Campylobacterales bacterium]|nr:hypothetical protein [Campylobacterales bacterium]
MLNFNSSGDLANSTFMQSNGSASVVNETWASLLITKNITVKNMYVSIGAGPQSGNSRIFTLRKNAVDTALTVTLSNLTVTGSDTTHTVNFAAFDLLAIKHTTSGGVPLGTNCILTVEYV